MRGQEAEMMRLMIGMGGCSRTAAPASYSVGTASAACGGERRVAATAAAAVRCLWRVGASVSPANQRDAVRIERRIDIQCRTGHRVASESGRACGVIPVGIQG